ncbi:hypothetical protein CAEBREN_13736 [Caenorhabditis brenneri]|uniref:T-box domain-containing protein n=1 Tax=Caenorhabditis brenneri TaxID=135651 RepID=G0MBD0_CAEBE|nr:hypothetical protein CAEBREN_13736 [Caenorhabditis brenneri]
MSLDDLKVSLAPNVRFFWKYFDTHFDHEMRIEKASTPVFPYLFYQVSGLDPNTAYSMALHFELASKQQFQYKDGKWRPFGTAENGSLKQVLHEWGVMRGREWMEKGFSFRSVRISRDFGTTSESVIPLNVRHKYRPVLSIRESPTPRKPCPAVIQCRLDHTEFITVSRFENEHVRSLKLMNRNGQTDREELWAKSVAEPPVFATCTLVNAHNASIPKLITPTLSSVATSIPRLLGLQDVTFTISKHQGEGDATQKKNITENTSTSSGSAHPLSVEKLYLSMDKKKATTREAKTTLESILRNCPPNFRKQLMDMQAAMNFNTVQIPTAFLTPGITPPRVEQPDAEQVNRAEVLKNGQEGIVQFPTAPIPPAVEPSRKKLPVEMHRGDRDTKGKRKVVCHPPTLAQGTFKNGSDVSKTPSTSESVSIHPLSVSNVEFFCRNCPPDLLEKMKAMTPQEAMYIDIGQFFEAYFTQGITPPGMEQQKAEQVVPVEVPKNGQVSIAPVPTAPILPAVEPSRKKLRVGLEREEGDTDEEEENVRLGHDNLSQPPVVPDGSLAQSMPKFRLPANQSDFPPQMFNSRFQRTPYSFPVTLPYLSSMAGLPRTFSANSMLQSSVVCPQYTFRMMPIQNIHLMTQPHRFVPFPHHNPNYPPMTQTLLHNNINSKKRPFQNGM